MGGGGYKGAPLGRGVTREGLPIYIDISIYIYNIYTSFIERLSCKNSRFLVVSGCLRGLRFLWFLTYYFEILCYVFLCSLMSSYVYDSFVMFSCFHLRRERSSLVILA